MPLFHYICKNSDQYDTNYAVGGGTTTISAAMSGITGTTTLTVSIPLVSIAVTPATVSLAPNTTQQYTATGTFADHSTQNITSSVSWTASTGATITAGGLATAVTPNTTVTIMAAQGNISGTATMTITNPLVAIAVTPSAPKIAPGTTQQFTATGTYADNSTQVITSAVTWASSNTAVATISNSQGTQGLASGLTAGATNITATLNSVTSPNDVLTVTNATLVSITVTPAGVQIPLASQQQYTATGHFSDGTTQNITGTVTWASSDTAHIRITVSGLATGVATISTPVTISATQSSVTGSTTATVIPPTVVSIAITPNLTRMAQNTSRQYTATATLTNGSTLNVTSLGTWTSLSPSIATVAGGLVNAQPVTLMSNSVTIMVTYNSVSQSITLDVTNATPSALTVTPALQTIPVGVTERYSATCTFSDATSQDVTLNTTWSSSMTGIATIVASGPSGGIASGVSNGRTTIQGSFLGVNGSTTLTISTATLLSITVKPPSVVLAPGSTLNYQAIGNYSDSTTQIITGQVTWSSSNNSVVMITTGGLATGQSAGSATITAKYQGKTGTGNVVVEGSNLVSIAVTVPIQTQPYTVPFDVSAQFQATGTFADSSTQNLTSNVTWASSDTAVATVSNSTGTQGIATGLASGQTSITAVFASIVGTATLNVTNATLVSITVMPSHQNVPVGTQVNYHAVGKFSDQSTVDLTNQATWVSTTPAVATINSIGQASAASVGTTMIQATFAQGTNSVMGMTDLTVH